MGKSLNPGGFISDIIFWLAGNWANNVRGLKEAELKPVFYGNSRERLVRNKIVNV